MFKNISGYEEQYCVSETGEVYSTPLDGKPNKMLKQEIVKSSKTNYRRVTLCKNGKTKRFQVHRLVASAFIENIYSKPFVNHIDNNGENNDKSNLEWCTHSENMIHAQKQGRLHNSQSRGGKLNLRQRKKILESIESDIGKKIGERIILGFNNYNKNKSAYFIDVKCSCGAEDIVEYANFNRGMHKQCRKCWALSKRIHKKEFYEPKQQYKTFIYQITKEGDIVKVFNSIMDAQRETGILNTGITKSIKKQRKTSGGFIWKREKIKI